MWETYERWMVEFVEMVKMVYGVDGCWRWILEMVGGDGGDCLWEIDAGDVEIVELVEMED